MPTQHASRAAAAQSGAVFNEVLSAAPGTPRRVDPDRAPELADLGRLARRGLHKVVRAARANDDATISALLRAHLGPGCDTFDVTTANWPGYEAANVQRALDAWLAQTDARTQLIGVPTTSEPLDLAALISGNGGLLPPMHPVNVARTQLPCGPQGQTIACIRSAIWLIEEAGRRTAVLFLLRMPEDGRMDNIVEIVSDDPAAGPLIADRLRRLGHEHNVFRGHVLSFDREMFGYGQSALTFHRRPDVSRDDLILDADLLAAIERQVVGVARHREALLAAGQHLKRGLLLYGPPGVGKTHTIRYLVSKLTDTTVIVLSGPALEAIGAACAAARALQPALVVIEDVDLIAEDRNESLGQNPLLFELLNQMDGLGGDNDIAFILTTNRADLLEPALAERPGRVDQAIEIELPDLAARRRLFDLYRAGLVIDATDAEVQDALTRAAGVTASFLKELLRRVALRAAERQSADAPGRAETPRPPLVATAEDLDAAVSDLLSTRNALTRTLLGSPPPENRFDDATSSSDLGDDGPGWEA